MDKALFEQGARVIRLSANGNGRDFVVGDIHGHFTALEILLDSVEFDRESDRLFSTGDLIDRGPESDKALWYLQRPWFYCVLGNHEQMLLDAARDNELAENWQNFNGGAWWRTVTAESRERFLAMLPKLPLAIEIDLGERRVGIVHADVPAGMDWPEFLAALERAEPEASDKALWSRERIYLAVADGEPGAVEGIDEVIVGHTPVQRPLTFRNVTYLDTGAGHKLAGAALTLRRLESRSRSWTLRTTPPNEETAG